MTKFTTAAKPTLAWTAILGSLSATGFGIGFFWIHSASQPTAVEAKPLTAMIQDSDLNAIADHSADGSQVYAQTWTSESILWYVLSSTGDKTSLVRADTTSGQSTTFNVPASDGPTPHTYLAEDSSGILWVGVGYSIIGFNTQTEEVEAKFVLRKEDALAVRGALDRGNSLPGTWITGLMADSEGRVSMVRNNVSAVFEVTTEGVAVLEQLPASPHGLQMITGRPQPFQYEGDSVAYLGRASASKAGTRIAGSVGGCGISANTATGEAELLAISVNYVAPIRFGRREPIEVNSNFAVAASSSEGAVFVFDCKTSELRRFQMATELVFPGGLAEDDSEGSVATQGQVEMQHRAVAVAISHAGRLAVSTDTGDILVTP